MQLRIPELLGLLQGETINRYSRKAELQERAIKILNSGGPTCEFRNKIREYYKKLPGIAKENNKSEKPALLVTANPTPPTPNQNLNAASKPSCTTTVTKKSTSQDSTGNPTTTVTDKSNNTIAAVKNGVLTNTNKTNTQVVANTTLTSTNNNNAKSTNRNIASYFVSMQKNMYQQQYANAVQNGPGSIAPTFPHDQYPVNPDVKLKKLAFFDVLAVLMKPSTLIPTNSTQRVQEGSFFFHLTPQQATEIANNRDIRNLNKVEHTVQVQLRFCLLETTSEQEDYFPPNITVKVNNKLCQLPNPIPTNKPGVEPKRPPRPVNITPNVKLSPTVANHISVSWCTEYNRGYAAACYLVRKLSSSQLLQRLKTKGIKPADYTRALIKEKLNEDADCEIATTLLKVSLMCPLGKMRMTTPCRASTCGHLQCFDASLYLQMNERKPTWNCPVCDKPAVYDNLVIDGYFQDVLASNKLSQDDNEIQLNKDGSWSTHISKGETCNLDTPAKPVAQKVEVISDDIEVISESPKSNSKPQVETTSNEATSTTAASSVTVDLTISDSDDDDLPLKRKVVTRSANGTAANQAKPKVNENVQHITVRVINNGKRIKFEADEDEHQTTDTETNKVKNESQTETEVDEKAANIRAANLRRKHKSRLQETPEHKAERLVAERERKKRSRLSETQEEAAIRKAINAKRMQERRQNETPEQKMARREAQAERQRLRRQVLSIQEAEAERQKLRRQNMSNEFHSLEPEEQKLAFLASVGLFRNNTDDFQSWEPELPEQMVTCLLEEDETPIELPDRVFKSEDFAEEPIKRAERGNRPKRYQKGGTPEEKAARRRAAEAERKRNKRRTQSAEQSAAEKAACAQRMRQLRQNETPEQAAARRAAGAERQRRKRNNQTPEEAAAERAANARRMREARQQRNASALGTKSNSEGYDSVEHSCDTPDTFDQSCDIPDDEESLLCLPQLLVEVDIITDEI